MLKIERNKIVKEGTDTNQISTDSDSSVVVNSDDVFLRLFLQEENSQKLPNVYIFACLLANKDV